MNSISSSSALSRNLITVVAHFSEALFTYKYIHAHVRVCK